MPFLPSVQLAGQHQLRILGRRIALNALPLILALGFAFGLGAATAQVAQARPIGVLSSGCYYNGRYIAHGHVIEMNGVPYLCQNGRWVLSPFFGPQEIQAR